MSSGECNHRPPLIFPGAKERVTDELWELELLSVLWGEDWIDNWFHLSITGNNTSDWINKREEYKMANSLNPMFDFNGEPIRVVIFEDNEGLIKRLVNWLLNR